MRCARCDWQPEPSEDNDDRVQLALHAIDAEHPLCGRCFRSLNDTEPRICALCVDSTRHLIKRIRDLYVEVALLVAEMRPSWHPQVGRSSDGMPLPGGNRLVMLGHGSKGNGEDEFTSREKDPVSVSFEVEYWALEVQDARCELAPDEARPFGATPQRILDRSLDYLSRHLQWASVNFRGFDQMHGDLQKLVGALEYATGHDLPTDRLNGDCLDCGAPLVRLYDRATGLAAVDATCTGCGQRYTPSRYKLALGEHLRAKAQWVPIATAAEWSGVNPRTVQTWANRGEIGSSCALDGEGRRLVSWPDLRSRLEEAS